MPSPEETPTQPQIIAANPTPPSMQAVTIESRLAAVEAHLRDLPNQRDTILSELRAEMANIRAEYKLAIANGLAEEAKKREALEKRFEELSAALQKEMGEQTTMLKGLVASNEAIATNMASITKSLSGVLSNPRVRSLAMSLLASLTIIAGLIAAWMTAKNAAPAPPPAVTVITAPPVATPAPRSSQ